MEGFDIGAYIGDSRQVGVFSRKSDINRGCLSQQPGFFYVPALVEIHCPGFLQFSWYCDLCGNERADDLARTVSAVNVFISVLDVTSLAEIFGHFQCRAGDRLHCFGPRCSTKTFTKIMLYYDVASIRNPLHHVVPQRLISISLEDCQYLVDPKKK